MTEPVRPARRTIPTVERLEDRMTPSDAGFVKGTYQYLLGRADGTGLNAFLNFLQTGGGIPSQVIQAFLNSTERLLGDLAPANTEAVDRYYLDLLKRPADAPGQFSWLHFLQSNQGDLQRVG